MAFGDWVISAGNPSLIIQWDTITPIQSLHSLVATGFAAEYAVGYLPGLNSTCGKFIVFHKQVNPANTDTPVVDAHGVFCQVQTSFSYNNSAYCVTYFPNLANQVVISKQSPNLALNDSTGLASGTYSGSAQRRYADVFVMGINWQTDPATGDMFIAGAVDGPISNVTTYAASIQADAGVNFFATKSVTSYTDGSSPYATGVTCGMHGAVPVGTYKDYYDMAFIYTD